MPPIIIQIQHKHLYYSASGQKKKTVDHESPLSDLDIPDGAPINEPIEEKSEEIKEQDKPTTQYHIKRRYRSSCTVNNEKLYT